MYLVSLELKNFRAIHQMSFGFREVKGEARRWSSFGRKWLRQEFSP